ncbi:Protein yippee-like F37A8.5 [Colletotrichum gloeosporioides]|uniref:Protein yippee-like F37A8.5 n=1 Tax=Colletotrichum gloeosporioides TaxID=474922 RepID=A0A8H4FPB3_COLGL|nr:Protein yippee-like F37A8.5 [Colletotrichum gloeosporioides]KAF3809346.1 Protein yippee-like F37A8.5 [Colletotrichum gloeosporioides]
MAPNIIVSRPTFPTYLLPSFNLPFRRRPSSPPPPPTTTTATTTPTPEASQIPSLSSSPTSSTTDEVPTPPNSPPPPPYQDTITTSSPSSPADTKLPPSRLRPRRQTRTKPAALTISRTQPDTLRCSTCSSDIAFASQIVSKGFTGRYGRAYLVSPTTLPTPASPSSTRNSGPAGPGTLANVRIGKCENRQLVTGWHVVADITCLLCSAKLGWKYVDAKELSQKYKVGKFILEVERVVPFRSWEDVSPGQGVCPDEDEDGVSDESESDEDEVMGGTKDKADAGDAVREGEESEEGSAGKDSSDPEEVEIELDSEDEDDLEDMFSGTWDPEVVAKRRSRRVTTAARKK